MTWQEGNYGRLLRVGVFTLMNTVVYILRRVQQISGFKTQDIGHSVILVPSKVSNKILKWT